MSQDNLQSFVKKYIENNPEDYKKAQIAGEEIMNNPIFEHPEKGMDYEGNVIRVNELKTLLENEIITLDDLTDEENVLLKSS